MTNTLKCATKGTAKIDIQINGEYEYFVVIVGTVLIRFLLFLLLPHFYLSFECWIHAFASSLVCARAIHIAFCLNWLNLQIPYLEYFCRTKFHLLLLYCTISCSIENGYKHTKRYKNKPKISEDIPSLRFACRNNLLFYAELLEWLKARFRWDRSENHTGILSEEDQKQNNEAARQQQNDGSQWNYVDIMTERRMWILKTPM